MQDQPIILEAAEADMNYWKRTKRITWVAAVVAGLAGWLPDMQAAQAAGTAAAVTFSDIKGHWAEGSVYRMSEWGILDGFPDGTFRPEEPVTADQFVKMLLLSYSEQYPNGERGFKRSFVQSLTDLNRNVLQRDHRDFSFKPSPTGYWAKSYIDLAEDLNILAKNQFSDYKVRLKREEVAEILYYTLKETSYLEDAVYSNAIAARFGDYQSLTARNQRFVAEICAKGIMEGYPNGYFGVGQEVTRAESLRILERLTDTSQRIDVIPDQSQGSLIKTVPAADGSWQKLVFPSGKMMGAYDIMQDAAALRGTNYDLTGTTLRLFRDAAAKAKALGTADDTDGEVSLWLEPAYRTYGVTFRLQEGVLARNEEAIRKFTDYIFGYSADTFYALFRDIHDKLAGGQPVENVTVDIGGYNVEVEARAGAGEASAVFSILER